MVESENNRYDLNDFLVIKLISGEEIFVSDMFEPGEILDDTSKIVVVRDPVQVSLRDSEGKLYIAFTPWMITSSEDHFPIQKSAIISYAPIQKKYADFYVKYLMGIQELAEKDEENNSEADNEPNLDSDEVFLRRIKGNPRKKK